MIWFGVEEEAPLDTLGQANLWLWNGARVLRGGYGRMLTTALVQFYDHEGTLVRGVSHWRAIMAWDIHSGSPLNPSEESNLPLPPKRRNL